MNIKTYPSGIYQILEIGGQIAVSQLEELRHLISGHISNGQTYIAIRFTDATYLYSGAIAVLISCFKQVKDAGRSLLIGTKKGDGGFTQANGNRRLIPIYVSMESLPSDYYQIEDFNLDSKAV